eukprot:CAMPEP_0205928664 /NCGR_PEP_ID=MMETSP1325-20131115/24862_1 /ASSEMBLY_ACC=CAM_ASM_000708 /TAXON_ID=236786 /ORGANISM="Florenciella sp., Strain RCC1007" /LENGTH=38 /DNA_ID= /DNA_START= /DNA_END= /DNA_ORIENTATION=
MAIPSNVINTPTAMAAGSTITARRLSAAATAVSATISE